MKLQYCIFKVSINNRKYNVVANYFLNDSLIDKVINEIIIKLNYIEIDNYSFCCFNNFFNIITKNENDLIIYSYYLDNEINPFYLLSTDNLNYELSLFKPLKEEIDNYIGNKYKSLIKAIFEALINNYKIYFKAEINQALFLFRLIGNLLPNELITKLSFGFGNCFDINYLLYSEYDDNYDGLYFDFYYNDYPDINISKYIDYLIDNLSLDNRINYDYINLLNGKLDYFKDNYSLANCLFYVDRINYDKNVLALKIYDNINNLIIDKYLLEIYKYIYINTDLKNEIIDLFFKNIDIFINNNLEYNEYIKEFDNIAFFDIALYLNNLKVKNEYNKLIFEAKDFNKLYLLLHLTLRDIINNNKSFVPNDDLLLFLDNAIKLRNWNQLNIFNEKINSINNKAFNRLMLILIDKIDKNYNGLLNYFSIEDAFKALEYCSYIDSIYYYQRIYTRISDRKKYIVEFYKREEVNKEYYSNLLKVFDKKYDTFLDNYKLYKINLIKNVTINDLDQIYNELYLDKYKSDNGIFISKIIEYLNQINDDILVDSVVDIYNRYYKQLNYNYKDVYDSIRIINEFVYKKYFLLIKDDYKYYNFLKELNNILANKRYIPNSYFKFIELGIRIKGAYINKDYLIIDEIINNKNFDKFNDDMINLFVIYYLKYFFIVYNYSEDRNYLINFYLFDYFINDKLFTKTIIQAFEEVDYNQGFVFKYLVMAINSMNDKYLKILKIILDNINNKKLKKYIIDYLNALDDIDWINKELNQAIKKFLNEFIKNRFSFWRIVCIKRKIKG